MNVTWLVGGAESRHIPLTRVGYQFLDQFGVIFPDCVGIHRSLLTDSALASLNFSAWKSVQLLKIQAVSPTQPDSVA